ncbi:hypothetical protein TcCL_Unassigned04819 [Trypanosoma cruzi]|nr:hypothetical protein TcCL_Unassigned04819 [Trypanosoma cruzi]
MAPVCMNLSSNVISRKQLCACHAYECAWDAFNVVDVGQSADHTAGQRKQIKRNTITIFSYLFTSDHSRSAQILVIECWHAQPAHTSSAHSGVRQRGHGEQQRGTHTRRAAEAAVDFAKT